MFNYMLSTGMVVMMLKYIYMRIRSVLSGINFPKNHIYQMTENV
jgi:hypothetical protein